MRRVLREQIRHRAHDCCEYCLMPAEFDDAAFEIDHIVAEKHHGPTEFENLALSCFPCNNHKGPNIAGIDSVSRAIFPLYHPFLQTFPYTIRSCKRGAIIFSTTGHFSLDCHLQVVRRLRCLKSICPTASLTVRR
jgi:hypothetical protein